MQNNIMPLLAMLSNVKNPMMFIQSIVRANPNLKPAYDRILQIQKSGQSIEEYTKNIMQTQNVNLNSLTDLAKQFLPH